MTQAPTEPDEIDAAVKAEMEALYASIDELLSHAFGDSNSSKACRDSLLGACDPEHYKFDYSDLLYLDHNKKHAALTVLKNRIQNSSSIEGLIGSEQFKRLDAIFEKENPLKPNGTRDWAFIR